MNEDKFIPLDATHKIYSVESKEIQNVIKRGKEQLLSSICSVMCSEQGAFLEEESIGPS